MSDIEVFLATKKSQVSTELASEWAELESLYTKKLWHQLSRKIQVFIRSEQLQSGTHLLELYENFVAHFELKIHPLILVDIATVVRTQMGESQQRLDFIRTIKEKVMANAKSKIICNALIGEALLENKKHNEVRDIIEESEVMLKERDGVTTAHGPHYLLCSKYYQAIGDHEEYYKNTLRYLGSTELSAISSEQQATLAFNLSIAALLAAEVFNFGELLTHPVIGSLKDTPNIWLIDLLKAFNTGDIKKYNELGRWWKTQVDLAARETEIRQKISVLALMEMVFRRPGNNRRLTFAEIATETSIHVTEVEHLVLRALGLGLVRGSLDQVDQIATMTWVKPRVLETSQIAGMRKILARWSEDVRTMELFLDQQAAEILA